MGEHPGTCSDGVRLMSETRAGTDQDEDGDGDDNDDNDDDHKDDEDRRRDEEGVPHAPQFQVFRRRWFVLSVLCLLNCSNAMLWLSFAPVADQTAQYLRVSVDQVNWLSIVYMVVAIPVSFMTTWMLDTWGLRVSLVLGSWLNMVGGILRYISILKPVPAVMWGFPVLMFGQTLCALAQPLVIFSPTKLAALWFPVHQRATANMLASMANPVGLLCANILSPLIVESTNNLPLMLGIYAVPAAVACLLATLGIQRSVPPSPPSASAETSTSEPFFQGMKLLLRNRPYMILLLCFGGGTGAFTAFSTLLEQILCVKGYTDDFAGLCGALFIFCGVLGAAIVGLCVDRTKQFTEATKVNMSLSALALTAFAVVSQMQDQRVAVATVCSLLGFFGFAVYPIAMELSVECSYPVGEASSSGLIFVSGQVQSIIYTMVLQALTQELADSPFSTCEALSWRVPVLVMAGLCSLGSCCFLLLFRTDYRRLRAEGTNEQGPQYGLLTA
ncbi:solute carrier family 49 member A3 isoform X1 [Scleropages formosus]|uniref:Solute carrier family 49 member 3 n=1 Tax=Scleropages formosus TaxID=113540 RepID=A0A8C9QU26_SCLFO|nr:solute carrier family 49 member A3 isoform X1 [Scleropages formosus]